MRWCGEPASCLPRIVDAKPDREADMNKADRAESGENVHHVRHVRLSIGLEADLCGAAFLKPAD